MSVPPRLRVSRSGFYASQMNYPSELLGSSVQLKETSAPFPEQSDEESVWNNPPQRGVPHDSHDDLNDERHLSSTTATPGPSRTQLAVPVQPPEGHEEKPADRLRDIIRRLPNELRTSSHTPPPPERPRSEADSDILDSDEDAMKSARKLAQSAQDSIRNIFRRHEQGRSSDEDVATPKHPHVGSGIPVFNRKGRRSEPSLALSSGSQRRVDEDEVERMTATADESSVMSFHQSQSQSHSQSLETYLAMFENTERDESTVASMMGQSSEVSLPVAPPVENLNESVVQFPQYDDTRTEDAEASTMLRTTDSVSPERPRATSAGGFARPGRISLLANRRRPMSSFGIREYGEISFPSGEVESSTPVKVQHERERNWGRASPSFSREREEEIRNHAHTHADPHSHIHDDAPKSLERRDSGSQSPIQVWERDRERNWNNPRPKPLGRRPSEEALRHSGSGKSPGTERRASYGAISSGSGIPRARVSSTGSTSSYGSALTPDGPSFRFRGNDRDRAEDAPSPSPGARSSTPQTNARMRTPSTPTAAEILFERERNWGRIQSPTAHVRTTSMPGLDPAASALRANGKASPNSKLERTQSLGRATSKPYLNGKGKDGGSRSTTPSRPRSGVVYQPASPSSTLIRRTSLIIPVKEETETESHATQSDHDAETSVANETQYLSMQTDRAPSPASSVPLPPSPRPESVELDSQAEGSPDVSRRTPPNTPPLSRAVLDKEATKGENDPADDPASSSPSNPFDLRAHAQVHASEPREPEQASSGEVDPVSTTPFTSPARPTASQTMTPSKRGFHQYSLPSPTMPEGGLPDLPSTSDEEEEDSQLSSVKEPTQNVVPLPRFGGKSHVTKTPRPPGGWQTPSGRTDVFDAGDQSVPQSQAVAALKLSGGDTQKEDSDSQSTPVVRPKDVPAESEAPHTEAPLRDTHTPPPRPNVRELSLVPLEPKTPAPPGAWSRTPSQRKSILKVRFDSPTISSHAKNTRSPSPDAVVHDANNILQSLAGDGSSPGTTPTGKSATNESPQKRVKANMVDAYGRELLYAHDGTPIRRLDERARTLSMDSQGSTMTSDSIASSTGESAGANDAKLVTSRRRPYLVDEFGEPLQGQEIDIPITTGPLPPLQTGFGAIVDLSTPIDEVDPPRLNPVSQDDPDVRKDNLKTIFDGMKQLSEIERESDQSATNIWTPSLEEQLERDEAKARQRQLRESAAAARQARGSLLDRLAMNVPLRLDARERSGKTQREPSRLLLWVAAFLLIGWFLYYALAQYVERRAQYLFLTTYYDPAFPGYFSAGDPHAPSLSDWLGIRPVSPTNLIRSWASYLMPRFIDPPNPFGTSVRPSPLPS